VFEDVNDVAMQVTEAGITAELLAMEAQQQ
jgi:hypothetical protein